MASDSEKLFKALNQRQQDFATAYLSTGNAFQSAISAGYSDKTAKNATVQLVENSGIAAYIASVRGDAAKTVDNSIADVREIAQFHTKVMRNDPSQVVITNKTVILGKGAYKEALEAIDYDKDTGEPVRVKFASKTKAAEDLGKHLGYYDKDNEQRKPSITIAVPDAANLPDVKGDKIE